MYSHLDIPAFPPLEHVYVGMHTTHTHNTHYSGGSHLYSQHLGDRQADLCEFKVSLAYTASSRPVKATQGRYKDFPWLTNLLKTPEITLGKMFFLWGRTKGKSRRKCQSGLSEVKHEVVMPCLLSPLPPEFISGSRMAESI